MKFSDFKKYIGIFILAVAIIIVYKTFDNFGYILDFIGEVFGLLTPFFIGAAIAFVLCPFCKKTENALRKVKVPFIRKYRRGFSVLSVYVIVVASIVLIMVAIIPQLVESVRSFMEQYPNMVNSVAEKIESLGIYKENTSLRDILDNDLVKSFINIFDLKNMNKYAKGVVNFGSSVAQVFIGIIISVYILIDRGEIRKIYMRFTRACLPEKFRNGFNHYCKTVGSFINRYIGCQLLDACIVFILCLIVLSVTRNEYASVIALMMGCLNLIPYFGAFIAVLISGLITLMSNGFMSAIVLVIILIVLQQIDANIIQPRLVASQLSIKPLLVILGVVLGGGFFGVFGMFIGVPVVALLKDIFDDVLEHRLEKKKSCEDSE